MAVEKVVVLDATGKVPITELPDRLASNPPTGKCKVTNIYVDPTTGKLTIEYDDIPK